MASFYVFTWMGYKQILGWPSTQVIPDEFRLVWVSIDEPDKFTKMFLASKGSSDKVLIKYFEKKCKIINKNKSKNKSKNKK